MTTRIGQVSRFLNWTEHSVQLRKRRRRRCHLINRHLILLGLLRRSFSRALLHFVDDICNCSTASYAVIVLDVGTPYLYMTVDGKLPLSNILNASNFS